MKSCFCIGRKRDHFDSDDEECRASFYSAVSGEATYERRNTFFGIRKRIPTKVDLLRHPSDEWWSDARTDVVRDLGAEPRVLGNTIMVKVLKREEKSDKEMDAYFPGFSMRSSRRYILVELLLGKRILVSLSEVVNTDMCDQWTEDSNVLSRWKLVVNPANVKIPPWSIRGPREAASVKVFFGSQNCSVRFHNKTMIITIDVFSKFMIRSFLPKLAFQPGRISDYLLVDYEERTVLCGYRLVFTKTLADLVAVH
jgi:hypothetical protein